MKSYKVAFLASAMFLASCKSTDFAHQPVKNYREPASSQELIQGARQVLNDISNPQIFNPTSCPTFVNSVTNYLFHLPADHFIPKTAQETEQLKTAGPEVIDTIFNIRVALHDKLQEFDGKKTLPLACVQKLREGFQYARFAEEYLLEWLIQQKVYTFKEAPILVNAKPSTWTNPSFEGFKIKSGDVFLVRGKSHVSAMIARIGDEEGNFSHIAIVGEDSKGQLHVVEALIQYGTIITPLEKWRKSYDARVALYRSKDSELAKKAARVMYDKARKALDQKKGIRYDFKMDDDDYSEFFCSEVVRYAYDIASGGRVKVPQFRSSLTKFKDREYPESLGVTKETLFAPYDIEVDPRFDFVAEYRHYPLLRQVRMQDAVLQSMYSWMIEKDYKFYWAPQHSGLAYIAKIARQFGLVSETLPKYMPIQSIRTNVKFEAVAKTLQENLYSKEKEYYAKNKYLPSFQEMMKINEEYRIKDCLLREESVKSQQAAYDRDSTKVDRSKFHWFFRSKTAKSCR
ncbi:hypothetical protein BDW_11265 [Bdellovibrio bacteriovorus W]|nr:hypothetical protein BDW_11265 [Bdellovibrio bacteriovorus W]